MHTFHLSLSLSRLSPSLSVAPRLTGIGRTHSSVSRSVMDPIAVSPMVFAQRGARAHASTCATPASRSAALRCVAHFYMCPGRRLSDFAVASNLDGRCAILRQGLKIDRSLRGNRPTKDNGALSNLARDEELANRIVVPAATSFVHSRPIRTRNMTICGDALHKDNGPHGRCAHISTMGWAEDSCCSHCGDDLQHTNMPSHTASGSICGSRGRGGESLRTSVSADTWM